MIDTPCPFCQEKDAEIVRLKLELDRREKFIEHATNRLAEFKEQINAFADRLSQQSKVGNGQ
jgi:hypothetical protein